MIIDKCAIIKKFSKLNNLENKKMNSTIWKTNISKLEKLLNIWSVRMISKI